MVSQETEEKGLRLFKEGRVIKEFESSKRIHFKVVGKTDVYFVIFDKEKNNFNCDCKFFSLHGEKCSHIIAAELTLQA